MLYVALIDQDREFLNQMCGLLNLYFSKNKRIGVIDAFDSVEAFYQSKKRYDVVLLDSDHEENITLGKYIRKVNFNCFICFTTTCIKHMQVAFDLHIFDYIEKPISEDRLFKLMDEIYRYAGKTLYGKTHLYFEIHKDEIVEIMISDILYFQYFDTSKQYHNRSTILYTKQGEFELRKKISDIFYHLPKDVFAIPHKSFIVNFLNVKAIREKEIIINNGSILPLSQKRCTEFKKAFEEYALYYK